MADISLMNTVEASERAASFNLRDPLSGDETDIVLRVVGRDSEAVRKAAAAFDRGKGAEMKDADERARERVRSMAVASLVGWENMEMGGQQVPFSLEKAREIIAVDGLFFMAEQIVSKSFNLANFRHPRSAD